MVAQLKILLAVAALMILTATIFGGVYMYKKIFRPAYDQEREAQELLDTNAPVPDLGQPVHQKALALIEAGDIDGACGDLEQIIEVYPGSKFVEESRRVLGEINLDRLFSKSPMPGKLEYTVKNGDSLAAIARNNSTTIAYIRHVNGLFSNVIHPGDRLVLYPFDFEITVDLKFQRLILWEKGKFLKDYTISEFKRPPQGSFPGKTKIADKIAWIDGKSIRLTDPDAGQAETWLQTPARATQPGVVICSKPDGDRAEERSELIAFGLFLGRGDIDELAVLTRVGTPVTIIH
ncbi:MAG: LysM peptidoglycan-binding domain-containing protein [Verrucomicrobiae bacterium]|nr:LysM peptidoglycan-binding domain-containing protein [Verrucomicrobiae bacterium]